jgi:outer membrane receptor protein involved in Fe transport
VLLCAIGFGSPANAARTRKCVTIPAESLKDALREYIRQTGIDLIYNADDILDAVSQEVRDAPLDTALGLMLENTGMSAVRDVSGAIIITRVRHSDLNPVYPGTEAVIVTGSRIARADDFAPPPVTAITAGVLSRTTPSNLPNALNKLPIFAPAQTSISASSAANGKGSRPPGNFMDLRGLGPIRTLILEDGHRMPATWFDGTIDVNTFPQLLMSHVDIVAGGVSAVYGSDAVSGVVNFILDHKFNGLKGLLQGGISSVGDAPSYRFGLAGGSGVLGDRGHLEFSIELYERDKILDQASRAYGDLSTQIVGAGTKANPYTLGTHAYISNTSFGGLVTNGPLAGRQFLPSGTLAPFDPGAATATANIGIGGDGGWLRHEDFSPSLFTAQVFGRADYDLTDTTHLYLQASYAQTRSNTRNQNLVQTAGSNSITIYSGNAFLKPDYQAMLTAAGMPSFNLNRYDEDFGNRINYTTQTGGLAVTAGLTGSFLSRYDWEIYVTHGEGRTKQTSFGNVNSQRFYAAVDAVAAPAGNPRGIAAGTIVCRTTLQAPDLYPGCVPIDIFGNGAPSQAAKSYVLGTTWWVAHNTMEDFAANITGALFENWAGPVKAAIGGEYRRQSLSETTNVPDNSFDPAGLRGDFAAGTLRWVKDIAAPAHGGNSIGEGNIELDVPLLKDAPLVGSLSANGAYRYANYSTSGAAETWKLGLAWQLFDDLRLRAMQSRDIRAPTLFDLYQGTQLTIVGHQDLLTNSGGSVNLMAQGNPGLVPEVSRNSTAGFVYQPGWLPRFSLSVDYYHLSIANAIATVSGASADVETLCNGSGGTSPFCQYIVRPNPITDTGLGNFPVLLTSRKLNIAATKVEGIDFEFSYTADLEEFSTSLAGGLGARFLWSHQPMLKTLTLPGAVVLNQAGTAQAPNDRITVIMSYSKGPFGLDMLERYQSSFRQSANPTLVYAIADVRAYLQTDIDLSYDFAALGHPITGFLSVDNVFNARGGLYQTSGFTGNPGMNYPVGPGADIFGRYFTIGLRLNMP